MSDPPVIRVRDITYRYPGAAAPALRGMGFEVRRGEIFGLLGPSGAGKSTTQRVLTGLLRDFDGEARVLGFDARQPTRALYQQIGVGFELPNLYSKLTARENLAFFAGLYRGPTLDPDELLATVGLAEHADVRAGAFSKGMRMRLNLCRALVHNPQLLFLDEPTGGLDPGLARSVRTTIRALNARGKTVLLSTHNMAEATELCHRVAFIVDGALAAVRAPGELLLEHGRRRVRVEVGEDGATTHHEFDLDGLADNAAFLGLLRRERVRTLHSQEATLEDVFIAVTGRELV